MRLHNSVTKKIPNQKKIKKQQIFCCFVTHEKSGIIKKTGVFPHLTEGKSFLKIQNLLLNQEELINFKTGEIFKKIKTSGDKFSHLHVSFLRKITYKCQVKGLLP